MRLLDRLMLLLGIGAVGLPAAEMGLLLAGSRLDLLASELYLGALIIWVILAQFWYRIWRWGGPLPGRGFSYTFSGPEAMAGLRMIRDMAEFCGSAGLEEFTVKAAEYAAQSGYQGPVRQEALARNLADLQLLIEHRLDP